MWPNKSYMYVNKKHYNEVLQWRSPNLFCTNLSECHIIACVVVIILSAPE